jgi:hypothetical protein
MRWPVRKEAVLEEAAAKVSVVSKTLAVLTHWIAMIMVKEVKARLVVGHMPSATLPTSVLAVVLTAMTMRRRKKW